MIYTDQRARICDVDGDTMENACVCVFEVMCDLEDNSLGFASCKYCCEYNNLFVLKMK